MGERPDRSARGMAVILVAAFACLQPGIDPVFLTLLSAAHGIAPANHGWIVGATQAAMALGSLFAWQCGARLPAFALPAAAVVALCASLATVRVDGTAAIIAIRALFGLAMGLIYTQAMSSAATLRPSGAYGAVFLIQLVLSTLVALTLPALAFPRMPGLALAALALVPLLLFALTITIARARQSGDPAPRQSLDRSARLDTPPAGWALAAATFFFICTTMIVWSFTGALATTAGITETAIGHAVAIGSIVGAITALCVMQGRIILPLPLSGLLCGLAIVSPLVLTPFGNPLVFTLSVILLNIGSTAMVIRCSTLATAHSTDPMFRRFVACTHSLGMIAGPVLGAILSRPLGDNGLQLGAMLALSGGITALVLAALWTRQMAVPRRFEKNCAMHNQIT